VRMVTRGEVETTNRRIIPLRVDTLCIHGDTPGAARIAAQLRAALEAASVQVVPLTRAIDQ